MFAEERFKPLAGVSAAGVDLGRAQSQFLGLHTSYNAGEGGFVTKKLPSVFPEMLGCQPCTFSHCSELSPDHGGMDFRIVSRLGGESTICTGHHVFAAHELGKSHKPFGNQLGMFHNLAGMCDHAWYQDLAFRQLHYFPDVILVFVPRVRGFEGIGARPDLKHHFDNITQRRIVNAWTLIDAVTSMEANLLLGN